MSGYWLVHTKTSKPFWYPDLASACSRQADLGGVIVICRGQSDSRPYEIPQGDDAMPASVPRPQPPRDERYQRYQFWLEAARDLTQGTQRFWVNLFPIPINQFYRRSLMDQEFMAQRAYAEFWMAWKATHGADR